MAGSWIAGVNPVNWIQAWILFWDWLTSRTWEVLIVLVLSSLGLRLPSTWLTWIGLNPASPTYHNVLYGLLWFAILYVCVFKGAEQIRRIGIGFRLKQLGDDEKSVLWQFIDTKSYSRCFQAGEAGTHNLEREGIIYPFSRANKAFNGLGHPMLCYSIKPWIFKKLSRKPILLKRF